MKTLWQWIGLAVAVIAAIFGASWAKERLESRGAKKQHDKQQNEADKVEADLKDSDAATDNETEIEVAAIEKRKAERHEAEAVEADQSPTQIEIDRFIEESK